MLFLRTAGLVIITTLSTLRLIAKRTAAPLLALLGTTSAYANGVSYLPALGNTEQTDHALSREVSDDHVYDGETLAPRVLNVSNDTESTTHPFASDPASSGRVIWDFIRQSDGLPLNDSEQVTKYKQSYIDKAFFTNQMLERSQPYLAHLVKALHERYLPVELALLPAIESGFQPHGVSANNAVGLWQIVPITAREIGVTRNRWFDGRADIVISTTAAIDYLSYLNAEFNGDWELTLAAYNAGPGRVRNAMKRNANAGKDTHFAALDLPTETRNYLPKFVALLQLIKDPTQTAIKLPAVPQEDAFESVDLGTRYSLDQLAQLSDVAEKTLRNLNPGLIHGVTPPDGPHTVYLPRGQAQRVQAVVAGTDPKLLFSVPSSHTVAGGETLGGIALRYGMSMRELQNINHLDSDRIKIGQILSVVDSRFVEETKLLQYVVASGDTLSEIAAQFSVNVSEIVTDAGKPLESDVIRPGDTLNIRVVSSNGS